MSVKCNLMNKTVHVVYKKGDKILHDSCTIFARSTLQTDLLAGIVGVLTGGCDRRRGLAAVLGRLGSKDGHWVKTAVEW